MLIFANNRKHKRKRKKRELFELINKKGLQRITYTVLSEQLKECSGGNNNPSHLMEWRVVFFWSLFHTLLA